MGNPRKTKLSFQRTEQTVISISGSHTPEIFTLCQMQKAVFRQSVITCDGNIVFTPDALTEFHTGHDC